jgi:hypothetical protein
MASPAISVSTQPANDIVESPVQTIVEVYCNGLKGRYDAGKNKVTILNGPHAGKACVPPEFERLAGRGAAKKWKTSVRIYNSKTESIGKPISEWLVANGYEKPRPTATPRTTATSPTFLNKAFQHRDAGRSDQRQLNSAKDLYNPYATGKFLGLGAMDSSARALPSSLSQLPDLPPGLHNNSRIHFNMDELAQEQLMQYASCTTSHDPLAALLQNAPGVAFDRQAYVSGQQPAKRQRTSFQQAHHMQPTQQLALQGVGSGALSSGNLSADGFSDAPSSASDGTVRGEHAEAQVQHQLRSFLRDMGYGEGSPSVAATLRAGQGNGEHILAHAMAAVSNRYQGSLASSNSAAAASEMLPPGGHSAYLAEMHGLQQQQQMPQQQLRPLAASNQFKTSHSFNHLAAPLPHTGNRPGMLDGIANLAGTHSSFQMQQAAAAASGSGSGSPSALLQQDGMPAARQGGSSSSYDPEAYAAQEEELCRRYMQEHVLRGGGMW